jgi:uncharacterized protein
MSSIDQQFVEFVVKSLVSDPDAVEVVRTIDEKGVLLELTVSPDDLGRVIGKRGATAQSIRTLLRALGTKNEARYNLKIVDNGVAPSASAPQQSSGGAWGADDATDASDDVVAEAPAKEESSLYQKTRQELAELDDLDV